MKKENFVSMVMGTVGGIFFAIGMCMCMIREWNAFPQGVIAGTAGLIILLVMAAVRRKMQGRPAVELSVKAVGTVVLAMAGALIFGIGMCMTVVWQGLLVQGIVTGIAGIVLLLSLIPLCRGIK